MCDKHKYKANLVKWNPTSIGHELNTEESFKIGSGKRRHMRTYT